MSAPAAIVASGLCRRFSTPDKVVTALQDVTVRVDAGEYVALVGKSGAGKSTFLNLIGALDRGYDGSLQVLGQEVRSLPDKQLSQFRNRQIGFVFQSFNLLPNLSVGDNVLLPGWFGKERNEAELRRRAQHLLDEVGLGDRFAQMPQQMSGGERQRVAIARALLLEPPLLVCDEPTGSLDAETARQILRLLEDLRQRRGSALVLVTHDPAIAAAAPRVLTLAAGRLISDDRSAARGGA